MIKYPFIINIKMLPVHKLLSYFPTFPLICLAESGLFRNFAYTKDKSYNKYNIMASKCEIKEKLKLHYEEYCRRI